MIDDKYSSASIDPDEKTGAVVKKNLVIVRAGSASLHRNWLDGADRNWDLALSTYGQPSDGDEEAIFHHHLGGAKFTALADLLKTYRQEVLRYDRVMFADDDIATDANTLNRFFLTVEEFDLDLSQPALHERSFYSHAVTIRNPEFRLRFVNFVELMIPCFSRTYLESAAMLFDENVSAWGIDYLWSYRISDPSKIAIVDEAPVLHARPIGGPMHGYFASIGIDPQEEARILFRKYNFTPSQPNATGGVGLDRTHYSIASASHGAFTIKLLHGYLQMSLDCPANFIDLIAESLATLPPVEIRNPLRQEPTPQHDGMLRTTRWWSRATKRIRTLF